MLLHHPLLATNFIPGKSTTDLGTLYISSSFGMTAVSCWGAV